MLIGILSDVHANVDALRAVFEDSSVNAWYFLGDAVGYGPYPVKALQLLRAKVPISRWLIGNHDATLLKLLNDEINDGAGQSILLHRKLLNDANLLQWCREKWTLKKMNPKRIKDSEFDAWLVHGSLAIVSPHDPINLYLFPWVSRDGVDYGREALKSLSKTGKSSQTQLLFHGHTHIPYARGVDKETHKLSYLSIYYQDHPLELDKFDQLLICPGSVGLPRNPDPEPHAAYGILDTTARTFQFRRVVYDAEPTRVEIDRQGYDKNKILQSYLIGAFPGHKFWDENPYWKEWCQLYQLRDWGWEVRRG